MWYGPYAHICGPWKGFNVVNSFIRSVFSYSYFLQQPISEKNMFMFLKVWILSFERDKKNRHKRYGLVDM